ncbi:hypothetical protein MHUMG1_03919 [Metarhizium humberi]|uniref:Uncharacterized protein n=1 Tax=Metarhizium humberi TaxID=2596975 RepID=A0A9P8MBX5_9HYPO|nr:hypothetical protein MHUMG1_03919 [Metarhizium humberi]
MPRKSSLAAPKSASKKQAKKQLRLQSAQFGELETTPTSHHGKSPIPPVRQKTRASHTDCHDTDQIVDPEEFEDGVDDNDMAKLADTPKEINTTRDREIIWSEKDSETHRSSSMSSEEEEQSGHVFGYIRDDIPFTSPATGHDALPDTLPLPAPPVKSSVIHYAESLVVDSDTNRQCVSRPSDPQHSLKDLHNDEISHDIIKEKAQMSQVMSPIPFENNDVGDFQTTDTETILPQSNRTRPQLSAVKTIKPTEKVGDCIFVATPQKRTGNDITTEKETWKDFSVLDPHMKSRPFAGVEGDGDAGVSTDDSKKTNSVAHTTGVTRSSSKPVNFQTSQAQRFSKSKMVQKTTTDRRIGQNFSVSERGSPIPRQQQDSKVDIPFHGHFEVQNCTLIPEKHRSQVQRAEEWAPVKANFESIKTPDLIQRGDHPELLQSIVSDIRRILTKHPNINKTEHATQPVTTSDRSRQQLHELVDVRFSDHVFVKDSSDD